MDDQAHHYKHGWIKVDGTSDSRNRSADKIAAQALGNHDSGHGSGATSTKGGGRSTSNNLPADAGQYMGSDPHIAYSVRPYPGESAPMHNWSYMENGKAISDLWADHKTGQIMQVETDTNRQGEGIASQLYRHAVKSVDLYHSPEEHRTPEGEAFARRVGGDTIPEHLAFNPG